MNTLFEIANCALGFLIVSGYLWVFTIVVFWGLSGIVEEKDDQ